MPRKPAWPSLVWNTSGSGRAGDPRPDPQRADAADAEQQLLAQPVLAVAAVQPVGDLDVVVGVALDVGVEHQQRHPADLGHPDPGHQVGAAGQRDGDRGAVAVGLAQQRDRQPVRVEHRVGLLLPALAGQRLLEVAVPVEQADADDRDAEVAGRLEVVTGQDAEAAGVLRQHGGDAELRARSRRSSAGPSPAAALVPAVLGEVALQVGARPPRAARGSPGRRPAPRAGRCRPHRAAAPGRGRSTPTARGRPRRRRPGRAGATTSGGCRRAHPAQPVRRAGQDGP